MSNVSVSRKVQVIIWVVAIIIWIPIINHVIDNYQSSRERAKYDAEMATLAKMVLSSTPCTYTVISAMPQFQAAGGNGGFSVTATGIGCTWTANSTAPWINDVKVVKARSDMESDSVSFTVDPNNEATSRIAKIFVADRTIGVTQYGKPTPK